MPYSTQDIGQVSEVASAQVNGLDQLLVIWNVMALYNYKRLRNMHVLTCWLSVILLYTMLLIHVETCHFVSNWT